MKITVLQENLKQELGYLQKVIPNKPQLPILSSILLKTENGKLILAATDLYLGIRSSLVAEIKEEGSFVVSGDIFRNLIFSLSPGKIDLELKEGTLYVVQGKTRSKLAAQSPEEYPSFPVVEGDEFDFQVQDLEKIQELVAFAASNDQTRPVLTSLLMKFNNDGLEVVGTDGFRLAKIKLSQLKFAFERDLLVPVKALGELSRIAKQAQSETVKIAISEELKQLLFKIDGVELFVRLIEGDYPPYEKIIPPEFKLSVAFESEELLSQLKRAQIFAREASNIVRFVFSQENGDHLQIKAISPTYGEYVGEMVVEKKSGEDLSKDENIQIAFNVLYLIDFINAVKSERLIFNFNENLKPALFSTPNEKDYIYIAMPFRVND